MPTINKCFLARLLLAFALLAGGLAGLHAIQSRRIPDAIKQHADRAETAGKTDDAIRHLRRYLEFRPTDLDATEQLATLLRTRSGDAPRTELAFLYDKVLRADPTRHATRREAAKHSLRYSRFADATTHAGALVKAFPRDAEAWQMLAAAQTGQREFDAAVSSYESAIQADPTAILAYQRLAQLHGRERRDSTAAGTTLDRMVTANPQSADAYFARARFAAMTPPTATGSDPVLADLDRVLGHNPNDRDAVLLRVERLQQRRESAAAFAALSDAVRRHPTDARLARQLAWMEMNRGNMPAAVAVLERAATQSPDGFELIVTLSELLLQLGDTARAEEGIRKFRARGGPNDRMQADYLAARVAMNRSAWSEAVALLSSVRTAAATNPVIETQANLMLALCHARTGDTAAERECLQLIVAKDATHIPARLALAHRALAEGEAGKALDEYEAAARSPAAGADVLVPLARLKIARSVDGNRPAAIAETDRWLQDIAPRFDAASDMPVILRTELNPARAVELLRAALAARPGDARLIVALAEAVASAIGTPAGLGVLDEAQSAGLDGPELRLARAGLYARDPAKLRPIRSLETDTDHWPDTDQLQLLAGLIEVYDGIDDEASVVRLYRRIAGRRANDLTIWEAVYRRAARANDRDAMSAARAAITRIAGASSPSAVLCDPTADAAKLIAAFGEQPNRFDACLALADAITDGKHKAELIRRAVRLAPAEYEPMRAWVGHLAANDPTQLARTLAEMNQDPKWRGAAFRRLIRPIASEKLLAACEPFVVKHPGGSGWLADQHATLGQKDRAIAVARRAAESGGTTDDWVRLTLLTGPDAMKAARERLAEVPYACAAATYCETPAARGWTPELRSATGQRAFADVRLAARLARHDRAGGITVLEQYRSTSTLPPADLRWATQQLALLLVIRGEPADRTRAVELASVTGSTLDDKRTTAAGLAMIARYLDGDDRATALARCVTLLEAVAVEGMATDQFALVQAYRSAGRMRECRERINKLLAIDQRNIDYLLAGIVELSDADAVAKAGEFADRLRTLFPNDFRAVAAIARYEVAAGKPTEALAAVERFAKSAEPMVVARTAELLAALARSPGVVGTPASRDFTDSAVAKFEAVAVGRTEVVVTAAGLLGADGRVDEAFEKIERFGKLLSPRTRAAAGLAALRAGSGTEKQYASIRQWLDAARAEDPTSVAVRLCEAEFLALRNDAAAAEAIYTAILSDDPRNVHALNNLAWLLAPKPDASLRALDYVNRAMRETGVTPELLDTRARVRIAAKQFVLAEADLADALRQGKTPLRLFHDALAKQGQQPPRPEEASRSFREAQQRGLKPTTVHPDDLPQYRAFVGAVGAGS